MSRMTRKRAVLICDHCYEDIQPGSAYLALHAFAKDKGGWWYPDIHLTCIVEWTIENHKGERKVAPVLVEERC